MKKPVIDEDGRLRLLSLLSSTGTTEWTSEDKGELLLRRIHTSYRFARKRCAAFSDSLPAHLVPARSSKEQLLNYIPFAFGSADRLGYPYLKRLAAEQGHEGKVLLFSYRLTDPIWLDFQSLEQKLKDLGVDPILIRSIYGC